MGPPTFGGEILRPSGFKIPLNNVSLLELPGQPRPPCWLREPLQIVDEPHIRLDANPLKESGATKVPLFKGLGIAIAGIREKP
jgi:hypothetical protein